ncbi:hypothetical protein [Methylobacterium gnaphalii]|uniref:Uncharacterized protein n=1 Tax=Methylobacterium gnaphalii TaxID=1010610 RepID=A0A512JN91_9HYPH|nr:hypothetical protein [Methylobacterium gnaphalii]GEP11430.1 hypothetical protein MGN01_32750 [Methylobacterium gnaphalii]GLS48024.1 hypothetical protein GCM10007885_08680 [Methylobacterium gnaphalii]
MAWAGLHAASIVPIAIEGISGIHAGIEPGEVLRMHGETSERRDQERQTEKNSAERGQGTGSCRPLMAGSAASCGLSAITNEEGGGIAAAALILEAEQRISNRR